jgi:putative nucleotidyltransferase with HDIG domain
MKLRRTTANLDLVHDLLASGVALARQMLVAPELADRWRHVQAVGRRAEELAVTVDAADRGLLVAAAWLHDIGYAPDLVETGMHSLDGARHLARCGYPDRVTALVAHHTGARFEADERGLSHELNEFSCEDSAVMDALVTADLTVGPQGQSMASDDRIEEILRRYPEESAVHRAIRRARPVLNSSVQRATGRLLALGVASNTSQMTRTPDQMK